MDETEREPQRERPPGDAPPPSQDRSPSGPASAPPPWRGGGGPDANRRRRGRRGRGGRPMGQPFVPGRPPAPARAPEDEDASSQMREIAAYERRQRQPPRGPWRGPGFRPQGGAGPRPPFAGPRPPFGGPRPGGFRPAGPPGGPGRQQRYQDMVRRATSAPRSGPPEEAGEPIAGPHAVIEALRAGRPIRRIYVAQERGVRSGAVQDLLREAQEKRVLIRFVERIDVERLSPGVEHQGVVAIAEGRQGVDLDELMLHLDTLTDPPLVLVIDSLQDPQNFGVLLRSAEGAGAAGAVIPRHRQVGLTPAVTRTSAGASEHLLIAEVANLRQAIDTLKEKGIWVVGTDDSGDMWWDEVDYRGATAIVVGGEGEGIRRLVLEGCDQVVRVPMQGKVSSLNAAAAGTVILFEALRQRLRDDAPPAADERPASAAPAEAIPPQDEQDELPEGVDDEPATEILRDDETPTGDEVRGDDVDVEEFAEAAARETATGEGRAAPRKRTTAKRTTAKRTAAKRTTKKKTE